MFDSFIAFFFRDVLPGFIICREYVVRGPALNTICNRQSGPGDAGLLQEHREGSPRTPYQRLPMLGLICARSFGDDKAHQIPLRVGHLGSYKSVIGEQPPHGAAITTWNFRDFLQKLITCTAILPTSYFRQEVACSGAVPSSGPFGGKEHIQSDIASLVWNFKSYVTISTFSHDPIHSWIWLPG